MDFIEFCEDVLGHPLSDWQKEYLTNMYDMFKKAKEENREVRFDIKPTRGSSKFNIHIAAIYLASEYDECLKGEKDAIIGHRMSDTESLNAVMGPVEMTRSDEIDRVLGIDKGEKDG